MIYIVYDNILIVVLTNLNHVLRLKTDATSLSVYAYVYVAHLHSHGGSLVLKTQMLLKRQQLTITNLLHQMRTPDAAASGLFTQTVGRICLAYDTTSRGSLKEGQPDPLCRFGTFYTAQQGGVLVR